MRQTIIAILLISISALTSCSKTNSNPGGTWTFEGNTYTVTSCPGGFGTLNASNMTTTNTNNYATVTVNFTNNMLPTANGTYTVVRSLPVGNQVLIRATAIGGLPSYTATGGNGLQTVQVSVTNGKITVSGSGIEMVNTSDPTDSAGLSLNITQL